MKMIFVDTETTGLDPKLNDIVQLAYIIEIDGEEKERGELYMQPVDYTTISPEALKVNGLTIEKLKTFPSSKEQHGKFVKILSKYVNRYNKYDKFMMVGYNGYFDKEFMNQWFLKNGDKYFGSLIDYHILDAMALINILRYKKIINLENSKLETASKHFGIKMDAHDAMSDINATRELFYKLMNFIGEEL